MPKRILEMTALEVSRLRVEGSHAVGGVSGLYLRIEGGSRTWVLRYVHMRQRRRMGLGSYPGVTLAAAREAARAAIGQRDAGTDPIKSRQDEREAARLAAAQRLEFDKAADAFITEHESTWRNAKHAQQWRNTLTTYASPHFGRLSVSEIDQSHVLRALSPIWKTKTETATRVRGRIEQVLDWATAHGHRTGPNPARWRGQLEHILANPEKVAPVKHRAAVPVADLPAAYQQIAAVDGQSARALCFLILTAVRSGEVRGMVWSEVDLTAALWVIPAERMKANREHRVPLSRQAVELLRTQEAAREELVEHVFPSNRKGSLSDMAFTALMRRHELGAVPHGFRSTFRDWAGETTHHPRDAVELCLAHTIDTKTEAAYRRGDMLEKRAARLLSVTDAKGNTHRFDYDKAGRLIQETRPGGSTTRLQYNLAGQLIQRTDAGGNTRRLQYDKAGNLTVEELLQADTTLEQRITYQYNANNQLLAYDQQDGQGQTISAASYQRDSLGRTTDSRMQIGGLAKALNLGQSYHPDGQLTGHTYPDGSQTLYSYQDGRLAQVKLPNGSAISYGDYQWNQPTKIQTPGATKTQTFDALRRPLGITVQGAAGQTGSMPFRVELDLSTHAA